MVHLEVSTNQIRVDIHSCMDTKTSSTIEWMRSFMGLAAVAFGACGFLTTSQAAVAVGTAVQGGTRSVWDAVYTDAQAERGKELYLKECGSCHADNLQGGDEAPGLAGGGFLSQWIDLSAGDLFERTRMTMPQDRPGQLSRDTYGDILAFMFKANGFPSGDVELPRDVQVLKQILIAVKPEQK